MTTIGMVLKENGFRRRGTVWSRDFLISNGTATMKVEPTGGGWKMWVKTAVGEKEAVVPEETMLGVVARLLAS